MIWTRHSHTVILCVHSVCDCVHAWVVYVLYLCVVCVCLCVCLHLSVGMCAGVYICGVQAHACVSTRGQPWVSFLRSHPFCFESH